VEENFYRYSWLLWCHVKWYQDDIWVGSFWRKSSEYTGETWGFGWGTL